jgi:hypothetical protein
MINPVMSRRGAHLTIWMLRSFCGFVSFMCEYYPFATVDSVQALWRLV